MTLKRSRFLGLDVAELTRLKGAWTASEIEQQPIVWQEVLATFNQHRHRIESYLAPVLKQTDLRIILTGAGTSSFIGKCIAPAMLNQLNRRVEAIATTELVSGPTLYFQPDVSTLLVSFARSGNSPESLAAVQLANQCCKNVHHLIITCNAQGELYLNSQLAQTSQRSLAILLPEATHDRGFAMTSSFTAMLYAVSLIFGLLPATPSDNTSLGQAAQFMIEQALPLVHALTNQQFERVIYLGSNGLRGLAEEAALKLLELSDGQVLGAYDSPLGFRHGPKTMINKKTLVVVFLSNDPATRQYDLDLLSELRTDGRAGKVVAISAKDDLAPDADNFLIPHFSNASDVALVLPYVVFAQLVAYFQSLAVKNTPDQPSKSGTVNRVVQGVIIYPLWKEA